MNQLHDHDLEPFSEESQTAVEKVESLPFNHAFEHALYENRLDRTVRFEYAHIGDDYDPTPFVIDSDIMTTRFPEMLRGIFPEDEYTIEELKIQQTEYGTNESMVATPATELLMSFNTHHGEHLISIASGVATYETQNEELEGVRYTFEPEVIIGLIAAFVYAKQYDPAHPDKAIELAESSLSTPRDPRVDFVEQLIMTLGDFSGHSTLETRAMFDTPNGPSIIATLREQEFPDKSAVSNKLILNEITEVNELSTSTEALLTQNIVNVDESANNIIKGRLTHHYAEQRTTVLSSLALTASEYIDPRVNYPRWVRTCKSFLKAIEEPMAAFTDLDEEPILD